ncbi:2-oxoglutarate ferredoxin oxidoreductase subunit beta [Candidatus Woesearchaeota archaeon CG08_land_8_20_14_0_20_43_7]|nr:MAG: 2-oxoglutarate ferredoxin oxidoreductase subunit beta [Candidatus Woesearchaeota archaeon CG08_land_8_20_14_0_20_43_7]
MAADGYINFKRFPTPWCPGCSNGVVMKATAMAFEELGLSRSNIVVVSGIGCAGRTAGFFNTDSVHGLHGRAIPLAEGIKRANPSLHVVVMSGDGDLLGIGGNHLLHSSRRDTKITVICFDNEIYGLTGGQMSPSTPKGVKTLTSYYGSHYPPVNAKGIISANSRHFYARTTVAHFIHMKNCIKEALSWDGFSFVDVRSTCISNYGRRLGFKSPSEMLNKLKIDFKMQSDPLCLREKELGIEKKDGS